MNKLERNKLQTIATEKYFIVVLFNYDVNFSVFG